MYEDVEQSNEASFMYSMSVSGAVAVRHTLVSGLHLIKIMQTR